MALPSAKSANLLNKRANVTDSVECDHSLKIPLNAVSVVPAWAVNKIVKK